MEWFAKGAGCGLKNVGSIWKRQIAFIEMEGRLINWGLGNFLRFPKG
jgi:hypothetical protein